MKQIIKSTVVIGLLLGMTCTAWGKGISGVANTVHNLSSTNTTGSTYAADNVDQVCVFCHTPHGGDLIAPLWNHSLPDASTFTHYNSATVSSYLAGLSVSRNISDESLLCMACHDGSVAVDHLINDPNSLNGASITIFFGQQDVDIRGIFGNPAGRIGGALGAANTSGNLSDDHPISFSYDSVLLDPMYSPAGPKDGHLRTVNEAETWGSEGVRFWGTNNRVECSTCHDPHVDYVSGINAPKDYTPFLIRPNDGSNLCLACHNK